MSSRKNPKPLKPRAQKLNEELITRSKRGGTHTDKTGKRSKQKTLKELWNELKDKP
jgi:hypothetical protein